MDDWLMWLEWGVWGSSGVLKCGAGYNERRKNGMEVSLSLLFSCEFSGSLYLWSGVGVLFCSVVAFIILYFPFLSMLLFQHVCREEGDVVSNASAGRSHSIPETPVRCLILPKKGCYYSAFAIWNLLSFRPELTPDSGELNSDSTSTMLITYISSTLD